MRFGLEESIAAHRASHTLSKDDKRLIVGVMKLLEPLFEIAESGKYQLYPAKRLKKSDIAKALSVSIRSRVSQVEFVKHSAPVPKQGWMNDEGYSCYREIGFAHAIRVSTDPWLDTILKKEYAMYCAAGTVDREAAERLFRQVFGNALHRAVNGSLFSGAAYPVEAALIQFIAFALTGNTSMTEWLIPLMRLLPRAIPLGMRSGPGEVWNVLVA
jgi:hypothetical protein